MKTRQLKDSFFDESANIFKVLASPLRLKLINYISYCPRTVENCAEKFGQSMQNVSLHLRALAKIEILKTEKVKNFRVYSLSEPRVLEVLGSELISSPRSILPENLTFNLGLEALAKQVKKGETKLVDLRDPEETVYIPVSEAIEFDPYSQNLNSFLQDIPASCETVFFCRGRWCEKMAETVKAAKQMRPNVKGAGFNAIQLNKLNELFQ